MNYITNITSGISELEKWQRVAVACMCAASMSPVVKRFAQPATLHAFEQGVNAIWKSVRDGGAESDIVSLRAAVDGLPEAMCDDSNIPAYDVMVALSVFVYALDTIIETDSAGQAITACYAATHYYGGCDHILTHGNKTLKIDPRHPPPPGRLESLQMRSQVRFVEMARRSEQPRGALIEEAQTIASQLGSEILSALPTITEKRGWDRI